MNTRSTIVVSLAAVAAAAAAPLGAQVYVVAAGGGGQFTDLATAIAAVPEGATLHVKPGSYSQFAIQGKSLTIIAEIPGTATVGVTANPVAITGLSASQRVHVSGLTLSVDFLVTQGAVSVSACSGGVYLDQMSLSGWGVARVTVDSSSDVHLTNWSAPAFVVPISDRVLISRSRVELAGWNIAGGAPCLRILQDSQVMVSDSTIQGARGRDTGPGWPGSSGSHAVTLDSSTVHFFGACTVQGGAGGRQGITWSSIPCHGGAGLIASACTLRAFGTSFTGGAPGGGTGAQPGQALVLSTTGFDQQASAGPSAFLSGTTGPGQLVKLSLRGPAGSPANLLLGTTTTLARSWPITLGAVCVVPTVAVDGLVIPAAGLLEVPVQLPQGWPHDSIVFAQFLLLDTTLNEVQASNSFAAVTR